MSWIEKLVGIRPHTQDVRGCLFGTYEYTATGSNNEIMAHLYWNYTRISPSSINRKLPDFV